MNSNDDNPYSSSTSAPLRSRYGEASARWQRIGAALYLLSLWPFGCAVYIIAIRFFVNPRQLHHPIQATFTFVVMLAFGATLMVFGRRCSREVIFYDDSEVAHAIPVPSTTIRSRRIPWLFVGTVMGTVIGTVAVSLLLAPSDDMLALVLWIILGSLVGLLVGVAFDFFQGRKLKA